MKLYSWRGAHRALFCPVLLLVFTVNLRPVQAAEEPEDFSELSIEELMNVEVIKNPVSALTSHIHKKGEWMVGYHYMYMDMDGIAQVNKALLQMDDMTQQNALLVEQSAAASKILGNQAEQLKTLVDYFTVDDDVYNQNVIMAEDKDSNNDIEQEDETDRHPLLATQISPFPPVFNINKDQEGDWEEF